MLGGALSPYKNLIIIAIIVVIVKCVLDWYLKTKSGYLLKAVGDNETLVTSMGIDKGKIKILGLAIANGLVSLSGSVFAQQQRFFDASMGGTALFGQISVFGFSISVILGSILYKGCVAAAIRIGLQSTDLKLVTAVLFLLILVLSSRIEKYQGRKRRKERA